ncbi:MAG: AAA family ATPase [Burkholderiaceae bacterium]
MQAHWQLACQGAPRIVILDGEAGIGKSCLIKAFAQALAAEGGRVLVSESFPGVQPIALGALRAWLGVKMPSPADAASPDQGARFEPLARALELRNGPTLLILDDLQWVDADSLDVVRFLAQTQRMAPWMILAARRLGEEPHDPRLPSLLDDLVATGFASTMKLSGLAPEAVESLIDETIHCHPAAGRAPPDTGRLRSLVHRWSGGNPLHVLEWTLLALREPDRPDETVPERIEAVVAGRLRVLSLVQRRVLNLIALAGERLSFATLSGISGLTDDALAATIESLEQRRLIADDRGDVRVAHETIRRVIIAGIRPVRRREMQHKLAETMAAALEDGDVDGAARIAGHFSAAARHAEATQWFGRAATDAQSLGAHRETVHLLRRALAEQSRLPQTAARHQRSARLLLGIAANAQVLEGFHSPTLVAACNELEALLEKIADATTRVQILNRLRQRYSVPGSLSRALALAERAARLAGPLGIPIFTLEADRALGQTLLHMGRYPQSDHHYALAARTLESSVATGALDEDQFSWPVHQLHNGWALVQWMLGNEPRPARCCVAPKI